MTMVQSEFNLDTQLKIYSFFNMNSFCIWWYHQFCPYLHACMWKIRENSWNKTVGIKHGKPKIWPNNTCTLGKLFMLLQTMLSREWCKVFPPINAFSPHSLVGDGHSKAVVASRATVARTRLRGWVARYPVIFQAGPITCVFFFYI